MAAWWAARATTAEQAMLGRRGEPHQGGAVGGCRPREGDPDGCTRAALRVTRCAHCASSREEQRDTAAMTSDKATPDNGSEVAYAGGLQPWRKAYPFLADDGNAFGCRFSSFEASIDWPPPLVWCILPRCKNRDLLIRQWHRSLLGGSGCDEKCPYPSKLLN